ncbi:MAG: hypothetical protein MUE81_07700 [Thermoflexibacter sp.]|jgi:hypothetical protein|nr:hypothetical protein [Thermoflexibacter sp.]
MVESLVQWTLLNNPPELSKFLNFDIAKIIGQEITTDFSRIDFVLANSANNHLIVELETTLDNKAKLNYCFNQTLNYKNVKFSELTSYCILYAEETNAKNKKIIEKFGKENDILIQTYSLENTKSLYTNTVERLSLNVGLALPNPKNYTICYLRWLNKIMKPFLDFGKEELTNEEIFLPFDNPSKSRTNFNCHERIAFDFELFSLKKSKYILTNYGRLFVENISPFVYNTSNVSSINLTNEQKRLLLKVLTNGNWEDKIHKVNIYWFLRFVEVTNGAWLPKKHDFEQNKLDIANGLFNVSYNGRTMHEFLTWCSNYCLELGLIEKIKSTTDYDQVFLTPLGVEVNNIFSLDLTLKKSRMNLSFKYLE